MKWLHQILILLLVTCCLWWADPAMAQQVQQRASHEGEEWTIRSLAFSPDGETLAFGSAHQHELTLDVIRQLPPQMRTEAIAGWKNGRLSFVDVKTGQKRRTVEHDGLPILSVAYSPDGKTLATGHAGKTITLWESQTGKAKVSLKPSMISGSLKDLAFSPDGAALAAVFAVGTRAWEVAVWDLPPGGQPQVLKGHDGGAGAVVFSPDGETLALGNESGSPYIKLWQSGSWKELGLLHVPRPTPRGLSTAVTALAFSPKGHVLAAGVETFLPSKNKPTEFGHGMGEIVLWNNRTREIEKRFRGHDGPVTCIAYSPDGRTLASSSLEKTIKLWDTETWELLATAKGHHVEVYGLAFSPDGKTLASGAAAGKVFGDHGEFKLWDVTEIVGRPGTK